MSNLTPRINDLESRDTQTDGKIAKNVIINGGFDFWQRGNSATAIGSGADYLTDRFYQQIGSGSPMAANQYREEDIPAELANNVKYCLVAETTTDGVPATNNFHVISQKIEGHFFKQLVGKNAVLSFYVKSSVVGTYTILLRNVGIDRHYATQYTIDSANTWEKKKIILPITETGGTWDYENGHGLEVIWSLGGGPDRNIPVLDTWTDAAGTFLSHSSQVNFNDTIGNTFKITGVMLTEDTGEPDFDPEFQRAGRNYQEEEHLCNRYLYILSGNQWTGLVGVARNTSTINYWVPTPAPLRVVPVVTNTGTVYIKQSDASANETFSTIGSTNGNGIGLSLGGVTLGFNIDSGLGNTFAYGLFFNGPSSIIFDSEL